MGRLRLLVGISVFWLALSMLSDGLDALVLPHHLVALTDAPSRATALGLLTFVGLLIGMLVQPLAGLLSDRLQPRWGRIGVIATGAVLNLISLALFRLTGSLLTVLVVYVLIQASASVAQAGLQGFIPDLVATRWRGRAAGLKLLMDVGGAMLGFALLGQLLASGGTPSALLAIGVVVALTLLLTVALVREPRQAAGPLASQVDLLSAFQLDLRTHQAFVRLVISRFLFLLGTYTVGRFFLYFVAEVLGLEAGAAAREAGTLLALVTLITVLAAVPAGLAADRFGRVPLMLVGAALSALGALLLTTASSSWQILVFGGVMALGAAAFSSANWAFTADLVPPAEAARFMGLANAGTAGAVAAAGLFGPLVDWGNSLAIGLGYKLLFACAAAAFASSALPARGVAPPHPRSVGSPLS